MTLPAIGTDLDVVDSAWLDRQHIPPFDHVLLVHRPVRDLRRIVSQLR